MTGHKVRDALLASLSPAHRLSCQRYLAAQDDVKQAQQVVKAARQAQREAYIPCLEFTIPIKGSVWPREGDILFNLRNNRYYEFVKRHTYPSATWLTVYSLNAKTGRRGRHIICCHGPTLLLPPSHPFVKKRANARLAERLEGKDV